MKKILLILPVMLCAYAAYSQASIFEDGKGESAYKIFGNAITVNTKNESVGFALNTLTRVPGGDNTRFNRLGINVKLAANEGLSALKNDKGFLIDGSIGAYYGWKKTSDVVAATAQWARETYVSLNMLVDRNKLFNINNSPDNIVYSKGYAGWKLEVGRYGEIANFLYGVSGNFGYATNSADLKQKTVATLTNTSADNSTMVFKEQSAFDANKFIGYQLNFHFNADGAILLNRKQSTVLANKIPPLFFGVHLRYEALKMEKPVCSPAIGFYAGKPGGGKNILVGLNLQFSDLFNTADEKSNAWKRAGINITAGFKLD